MRRTNCHMIHTQQWPAPSIVAMPAIAFWSLRLIYLARRQNCRTDCSSNYSLSCGQPKQSSRELQYLDDTQETRQILDGRDGMQGIPTGIYHAATPFPPSQSPPHVGGCRFPELNPNNGSGSSGRLGELVVRVGFAE